MAGCPIYLPHVAPYIGVYCNSTLHYNTPETAHLFCGNLYLSDQERRSPNITNIQFPQDCNYHLHLNNGYMRLTEIVKDNNRGVTCNAESQSMGSQYEGSQKPGETYLRKICRRHITDPGLC